MILNLSFINKNLFCFIFILLYFNYSNAQTIIQPGNVSGTWTKSGSPYEVRGDITIPKGSTLTIEPGVVVEFGSKYTVFVEGIINAIGKKGDSITFKAAPTQTWCGFVFYRNTESDTIEFNYTRWENVSEKWLTYKGKYPFEWRKFVVLVSRNIFCAYSSPLKVKNSSFYFNEPKKKQANLIYTFKTPLIVDSVFITSSSDTIAQSGGLIGCDSSNYFSITNVKANKIKYFTSIISTFYCNALAQFPFLISNITVDECKRSSAIVFTSCRYGSVNNITGNNIRQGFSINECRNVGIKNANISYANVAIASGNICVGTIFENCQFNACGIATQQWSMTLSSNGPLFKNSKFVNSRSGIFISQSGGPGTPIFLNCEFSESKARAATIEGYPLFINCNFTNNSDVYTTYTGSTNLPYMAGVVVLREFDNSRPYFYNCLFWGNKDSFNNGNSLELIGTVVKADLTNCIIQGDSVTGIVGYDDNVFKKIPIPTGNLTYKNSNGNAPGFKDSSAGDFRLINTCNQTAYAINKGMSGNLLTQYPFTILKSQYGVDIYNTTDLDGNLRVMDDTIDIGCYESSGSKKSIKLRSTYSDTTLCYGASNNYSTFTFGSVQTYNWQKKTGSNVNTISSNSNLSLSNLQTPTQEYRLLVSNNECLPLKDSSRWFTININNPLKKGILKNPNIDTIALMDTMKLSTSTNGYQSFLWSNNATSSSIQFIGSSLGPIGTYRFTLAARNNSGCLETDTTYIVTKDNPKSLKGIGYKQIPVVLYPQPAGDILYLSIQNNNTANFRLSISNLLGASCYEEKIEGNSFSIDISALQSGIYFLTIVNTTTGEKSIVKWVKE